MPPFLLNAGRYVLVAALFTALGGHWAVLQTIAWGTMIVDYSQEAKIGQAVKMTFDGQHPCALCKQVRNGSQSEKKSQMVVIVKRTMCCPLLAAPLLSPRQESWLTRIVDVHAGTRSQLPPTPPPRLA